MNRHSKVSKEHVASGLMNEPRRGDGILWQVSKRVFKKAKDFRPVTHNQIVNEFRTIDKENELHGYYKPERKAPTISTTCLDSLLKQPKRDLYSKVSRGSLTMLDEWILVCPTSNQRQGRL